MKFATEKSTSIDGRLLLVSKDLSTAIPVDDIAPTLQFALECWEELAPHLEYRYRALNAGQVSNANLLDTYILTAPLPRTWQWLDGSCFLNHGHLMQKAFALDPIEDADRTPLVYQGAGDNFCGPTDPIIIPEDGIGADFEGELGVITGPVAMGSSPEQAMSAIRLLVMLNDISYRTLAPREMKTGFGFIQAKGATALAPIAITPDELGDTWHQGRVHLSLSIHRNDTVFGSPSAAEMHFGFHQLVAHCARTRSLNAGTVVGSGTVSDANPDVGQACIAELRAKELIKFNAPQTAFLEAGETVSMQMLDSVGNSVFGSIQQPVMAKES